MLSILGFFITFSSWALALALVSPPCCCCCCWGWGWGWGWPYTDGMCLPFLLSFFLPFFLPVREVCDMSNFFLLFFSISCPHLSYPILSYVLTLNKNMANLIRIILHISNNISSFYLLLLLLVFSSWSFIHSFIHSACAEVGVCCGHKTKHILVCVR